MDKLQLHSHCLELVRNRITGIVEAMESAREASQGETKSSAGDKYETTRAMMQLELDRLGGQLLEARKLEAQLLRLDPHKKYTQAFAGALLHTNRGWYYLAVGLGKLELEKETVMVLSPEAPLSKVMLGKFPGDHLVWMKEQITVLEIL